MSAKRDIWELQDKNVYTKWLNESFKLHLEKNRDVYYHCPTPNCPTIVEKSILDVIRCPACQKSACIKCYNDHKDNVDCYQYEEWKKLNDKAEIIFEWDVKGCKRFVEKISGCNRLQCMCGKKFLWIE